MRIINLHTSSEESRLPGRCVATIGFFDGVHRGHRSLIAQVEAEAQKRSASSVLLTFSNHPKSVLDSGKQPLCLTTADEKLELMAQTGADYAVLMPFTDELAQLSAKEFMNQILAQKLDIQALVVGYDHRFGHNRSDTFEDYVRHGHDCGIDVVLAHSLQPDAEVQVSSSKIRHSLLKGDLIYANNALGYNYFLQGHIGEGHQVGRTLGFPTANLIVDDSTKLIPCGGAYAVECIIDHTLSLRGMLNIGNRPTLHNGSEQSIEVHLFDFNQNIYSHHLRIKFLKFIRVERQFQSLDELRLQLQEDEKACKAI